MYICENRKSMHKIDSPMFNGVIRDFCHKIFYGSTTYIRANRVKDNIVNLTKNKKSRLVNYQNKIR